MPGRIRKFFALSSRRKGLLFEAYFQLGAWRFRLLNKPFKSLVSGLDVHSGEGEQVEPGNSDLDLALDIGWAVRTAARFTPWESACLVQVLAAQHMLQKRGIGGAFHLGATLPSESLDSDMAAHAWLKCGDRFITGESGHKRFTVVSTFSW